MSRPGRPGAAPISRRLLANLLGALAILALLEGACRLAETDSKYVPSESVGYELRPGYSGRREHVNHAGLRGDEVGPRTPGSFRILAIGASTTWGHRLADDETWPACLQQRLRRDGLGGAEVLNGGVSGWGLEQMVIALRERLLAELRPDLVLVYAGWNWPTLDGNANIERFLRDSASSRHADWLHRSALVRWLDRKVSGWRSPALPSDGTARASGAEEGSDEAAADTPFAGRHGLVARMQAAFPPLYADLAALCREHGAAVAIVRYPGLAQLPLPDDPALRGRYEELLRTDYTASEPLADLARAARDEYASAMQVIDAAAADAGLTELDLGGRLFAACGSTAEWLALFRDRMHLTPAGDAAIADAMTQLLAESGLLPPH